MKKIMKLMMVCLLTFAFTGCGSKKESSQANNKQQVESVYDEANKVFDDDPNGWWICTHDEKGEPLSSFDTIEIDLNKGIWNVYNRTGSKMFEGLSCRFSDGVLTLGDVYGFSEQEDVYECSKGKLIRCGDVEFEKVKDPMFEDVASKFDGKWYRNGSKDSYLDIQGNTYHKYTKENEESSNPDEKGQLEFEKENYRNINEDGEIVQGVMVGYTMTSDGIGENLILRHHGQVLLTLQPGSEPCFYVKEGTDSKLIDGYKKMLDLLSYHVIGVRDDVRLEFDHSEFYILEFVDEFGETKPIENGVWEVKDDQTFTLHFEDGTSEDVAFPNAKKEFTIKKVDKTLRVDEI